MDTITRYTPVIFKYVKITLPGLNISNKPRMIANRDNTKLFGFFKFIYLDNISIDITNKYRLNNIGNIFSINP